MAPVCFADKSSKVRSATSVQVTHACHYVMRNFILANVEHCRSAAKCRPASSVMWQKTSFEGNVRTLCNARARDIHAVDNEAKHWRDHTRKSAEHKGIQL